MKVNKKRRDDAHIYDIVRARRLKLFGHVARVDKSQDHSRALSMHMAQSQGLEAASRSSETYLAENGGGRPASVQPRSCIRIQEGTGQNYLARTYRNGYVTDKPRMMMMMMMMMTHGLVLHIPSHTKCLCRRNNNNHTSL